jgi:GxxExxY protein
MVVVELNALAKRALDAAFAVHTELELGLLESTYTACLKYELEKRGLEVRAAVPVPAGRDLSAVNGL